jgi:hypothetical protein
MALDNVDQGNTSEPPMGNEAAEDDDEPDERDNSATIQKMCKHARKHFSPADWGEFHAAVKKNHDAVMSGAEVEAMDEPPPFPGRHRPGGKMDPERAHDAASGSASQPSSMPRRTQATCLK